MKINIGPIFINQTSRSYLNHRGFFGIGIEHTKSELNMGTLWRSASIMGASFIFTIGKRYKRQGSDTMKSWKHIPLYNYKTFDEFYKLIPHDCLLTGIEITDKSIPITEFKHPERTIYLLGAEDHGLTNNAISKCHRIIQLPGQYCMNVAVAGSIVMYDRIIKYKL